MKKNASINILSLLIICNTFTNSNLPSVVQPPTTCNQNTHILDDRSLISYDDQNKQL